MPMTSRERVRRVIRHEAPDRVPVYGWVSANLSGPIRQAFGSVAAFEDYYEFDLAHLFGGPPTWDAESLQALRRDRGGVLEPADLLDLATVDPDNPADYADLRRQLRHHGVERGRFCYVQTPGIFEALNGVFGIENHLLYLALYPEELKQVYRKQADWNVRFAHHCLDLGVDMIHVSDDWGGQNSLLFSVPMWRAMIFPYHQQLTAAVKSRNALVSLHTDGNNNAAIDGILELGYDVVHPWQESAGMDLGGFRERHRRRFTVMGGLDVQTTIGFGDLDRLGAAIDRVLGMFADGGLIYCTTHFIQNHCTLDELVFAYQRIHRRVREQAARG